MLFNQSINQSIERANHRFINQSINQASNQVNHQAQSNRWSENTHKKPKPTESWTEVGVTLKTAKSGTHQLENVLGQILFHGEQFLSGKEVEEHGLKTILQADPTPAHQVPCQFHAYHKWKRIFQSIFMKIRHEVDCQSKPAKQKLTCLLARLRLPAC